MHSIYSIKLSSVFEGNRNDESNADKGKLLHAREEVTLPCKVDFLVYSSIAMIRLLSWFIPVKCDYVTSPVLTLLCCSIHPLVYIVH